MALKHTYQSAIADVGNASLVQPSNWNAEHIADTSGVLMATTATSPTAPSSGQLSIYGRTVGGGPMASYMPPAGRSTALQPYIAQAKILHISALGNTTSFSTIGGPAPQINTATQRNVATTNLFVSTRRVGTVSAATAGSSCGLRTIPLQWWLGNGAGLGGFRAVFRWGCSDAATVSGARSLVGMVSITTQIGNVNPSTLTNFVGVGTDAGDTNYSIMTNDGSGTATKTSLGANFPDHTLSTDLYELVLFSAANSGTIQYEMTRLNTGDVATGSITTDIPSTTTLLTPQIWRNNGATALAVAQDVVQFYIESDF